MSNSNNSLSDYTLEIDPDFENDFHPDVVDEFIKITCDPNAFTDPDPNIQLAAEFFAREIDRCVLEKMSNNSVSNNSVSEKDEV